MNSSSIEIKHTWTIIGTGKESVLELRAIWPPAVLSSKSPITKHFRATEFQSIEACKEAFESEALRLNGLGYNIYIVMNPIKPNFIGGAATDADIDYRDLLLIDIDRVEKKKEPATDDEVGVAGQLAEHVMAYLSELGWAEPIRVMSGNGHHLYYVLSNTPNNDVSKEYVQSLLKKLAAKFDNSIVKIDTSVFNASRITKVVGTVARKGIESEGRPYRMAHVL